LVAHDCSALRRLQTQVAATSTVAVSGVVAQFTLKCVEKQPQAAAGDSGSKATPTGAEPAPDLAEGRVARVIHDAPPKNPCETMNVDDVISQASKQCTTGSAKAHLQLMIKALACKQDAGFGAYFEAAMCACAAHEASYAKLYYAKTLEGAHALIALRCRQGGITLP
jgi:hypothetical protein